MVTVLRLRLEGEVRRVLVRGVIPERELDGTTVNTRVLAVGSRKASEPSNTAEELTLDGGRTLGVTIRLVQKDGTAGATVVSHLLRTSYLSVFTKHGVWQPKTYYDRV
jgi:hypothetical protein